MSVNKVILVGRLGKDPESTQARSGTQIVKFSLATDHRKGGERETSWHNIICFGKTAELCERFLSKGRQVYIEGRIEYSSYEKEGVMKYYTNIVAQNVTFLSNSDDSGGRGNSGGGGGGNSGGGGGGNSGGGGGSYNDGLSDNEIPF